MQPWGKDKKGSVRIGFDGEEKVGNPPRDENTKHGDINQLRARLFCFLIGCPQVVGLALDGANLLPSNNQYVNMGVDHEYKRK